MHTARSRNDQVATDLRLWQRDAIEQIDAPACRNSNGPSSAAAIATAIASCPAIRTCNVPSPCWPPHYWLAYCERLERDRARLADCLRRTNVLPLGAAALAGTSLPIDRQIRRPSGWIRLRVAANSLDASSDRDFVIEFAFALSLIAVHLSGWAEEWILWCTSEFNFLKLAAGVLHRLVDHAAEGQPRRAGIDPRQDGPRRRRSAGAADAHQRTAAGLQPRLAGRQAAAVRCVRHGFGLPGIGGAAGGRRRIEPRSAIAERLDRGHLDATTLMEELIRRGTPQRTAHELVGRLVRKALDRGVTLAELSPADFQEIDPSLDGSLREVLGVDRAIARFQSYGSTAPAEVEKQVAAWKAKLLQPWIHPL